MFCSRTDPNKIVAMASILILGGVLPLAGALISQYGFGLHPCHFCLLQRYPYLVTIAMGALLLALPRMGLKWRFALALGILATAATGVLGLIHTGIERRWLQYSGGCVADISTGQSLDDLRNAIMNAPIVACNEVTASFAGLSMASWNALWAFFVIALIALQYRFELRRYVCT